MTKQSFFFATLIIAIATLSGCKKDDDTTTTQDLTLNLIGLEDLGADYAYEGWLIVDGAPVSAGIFTVDADGTPSQTSFSLDADDVANATAYVLTIEPSPDNDPTPSSTHILAGDFGTADAVLTVDHGAALGTDFTASTGGYILATPTDGGSTTDENSGVWWLDPAQGPGPALSLPTLPAGWAYEGWAVINGTPVSTGTFLTASGADDAAPHSGTTDGPPYPGEDFLNNAPADLTFPTDLSDATIVVSVEPSPDNSAAPFTLKPLVGGVPAAAVDHVLYDMSNNAAATNPRGTASR